MFCSSVSRSEQIKTLSYYVLEIVTAMKNISLQFPHLELVASIGLKVMFSEDEESDTTPYICDNAVQHFMHGLFEFYFNKNRKHLYEKGDKQWFLQSANQQVSFTSQALSESVSPFDSGGNVEILSKAGSLCSFKTYLSRMLHPSSSDSKLLKFVQQVV